MRYGIPLKLLILLGLITTNEALKILVCFPMPSKSHSILGHGVVNRLLEAGHEVVHITSFPKEKPVPNLIELNVSSIGDDFKEKLKNSDTFKLKNMMGTNIGDSLFFHIFTYNMHKNFIQEPSVVKLFSDPKEKFDAVILEWFYSEINVGIIITPLESWLYNSVYPEIAEKRGVTMPSYSDAMYNGSLMFINSHPSIGSAIKLPQNAINIAGYHIQDKVKPLPKDLQELMDGAKYGVIYFSMGSNLLSNGMSEEMIRSLLKLFNKLDQIVIWKFESDMKDVPANVHLVKWAPQPSILSHPNLKLFITHGGQLSTTEAIHYGVPLVGLPIIADQHLNMASVENKGFGIKVTLAEDMFEELDAAIRTVLSDKSYKQKAVELSSIYHDRPMKVGKEIPYWVEYVVKTRGAPHLRSPSLTVTLYQRFYLDLLFLLVVLAIVTKKIMKYLLKFRSKNFSSKSGKKD